MNFLEPVDIRLGPSVALGAYSTSLREAFSSLKIPSHLHYFTPRQAETWSRLQNKHAPDALAKFYEESCSWLYKHLHSELDHKTWIISYGCGNGWKEATFVSGFGKRGKTVNLVLVDISAELVATAMRLVKAASSTSDVRGYVGNFFSELQNILRFAPKENRMHFFFGILPNYDLAHFHSLLDKAVQAGETALFSVNLLNSHSADVAAELATVRSQYDNSETRNWLRILPADLGWQLRPTEIEFHQEPNTASPEVIAPIQFRFYATVPKTKFFLPEGISQPPAGTRLELFFTQRFWHNQLPHILNQNHWELIATRVCLRNREALVLARKSP